MVAKATFHGQFFYYENINGKQKKVEKSFTDKKRYDDFVKKHPMPSFGALLGLGAPKTKALPKKSCKCTSKKPSKCCKK